MSTQVWINGRVQDVIPVTDRGLAYGDGVFETIRITAGELTLATLHWRRLEMGCQRLNLLFDLAELKQEVTRFLRFYNIASGVLKVIITRGSGGRGYNSAGCHAVRRILSLYPLPVYPETVKQGVRIRLCETRLGQTALAGIKHLNRIEQVLARSEWGDPDCYEGLLLSFDDHLVEGTMSNLFLVNSAGVLITPKLDRYGVAGVCRQFILDQAADWGLVVSEAEVSVTALANAGEVFVCNSVNGVWPVVACHHYQWPLGAVTKIVRDQVAGLLDA